jgi:acyl carrier protein|tara:strand:- start:3636 stop:3875 length:240 start_codon:yes stop_codon:yes gene_type:complete
MNNNIEDRIKYVISAIFEIPAGEINDESSPKTIVSWDSLKHMNLVIALEEEFRFEFTDEEILAMKDYTSIKQTVIDSVF